MKVGNSGTGTFYASRFEAEAAKKQLQEQLAEDLRLKFAMTAMGCSWSIIVDEFIKHMVHIGTKIIEVKNSVCCICH